MPSIRQSIRSSTASKRPTSAIADGQIALNTASGTPGMFFKDNAGNIIKTGPAHYGASAPNSSPAVGGSTGNSIGEAWLDSSLTPAGWKIWNGSAWVNATPLSSDTVQGLVELATNAETQAGADTARAVTSAGLQSKVSDSISTASSSGIASSSAVKTAYDLANAALPKSGGIITGNLEIGSTGSLTFEGSTADGFETTLAVVDPTLDRTITFPNITGTVVTTGDTGTVTSTMILDGTIVDADINASAEIAVSKLADGAARQLLQTDAAGTGVEWASNIDIPGTLDVTSAATFDSTVAVTGALTKSGNNVVTVGDTGTVTSTMILDGTILNADVNASAAIAGTKISPDFGAQTIVTTGVHSAAAGSAAAPSMTFTGDLNTGIYSPGADQVAISTSGTGRITVDASGNVNIDSNTLYVDAVNNRVGVGTSSPSSFLHLAAASGTVQMQFNSGGTSSYIGHDSAFTGFDIAAGGGIRFRYFDGATFADAMRITSAGLVGIGTTSPGYPLTVNGRISYVGAIGEGADTTLSSSSTTLIVGDSATWQNLALKTNGQNRIYVNSAGNVGIGTTSPTAPLEISATSAGLRVTSSNTGTSYINLGDTDSANIGGFEYYHTTNNLAFIVNQNEAFRVDSSRRLLVGTSSAFDATADAVIQAATTNGAFACLGNSDTSIVANENLGLLRFFSRGGSVWEEGARIEAEADLDHASGDKPTRLVFSTTADGAASPTERMRIGSNGTVTIRNDGQLYVSNATGGSGGLVAQNSSNNTSTKVVRFLGWDSSETGSISTFVNTTAYTTSSDYRLKENIIPVVDGIARAKKLKPYRFNFTSNPGFTVDGFVAHETQSVVPEAIVGTKDEVDADGNPVYQGIDHSKLVPLLTAALQEAIARIETLEARLTTAGIE